MTKFELIKMNQTLLTTLVENKISPKEVQNIKIFEEYREMKAKKHKVGYIVVFLTGKYALSESTIYTLIRRMAERVKL